MMQTRLVQNPVFLKELRARMRGRRAHILLMIYVALLSLLAVLVYLVFLTSRPASALGVERQILGKAIFAVVVGMELLSVSFIAPAITAGAISSEREQQTYDLLRITLLPARSLVAGKFFSGLVFVFLLLLVALPVQSLAFLFGGVALEEVFVATALLMVTAILFCAVGVFFSSFITRTLAATVLAYAFAILLIFGLPLLFIVLFSLFNSASGFFSASGVFTDPPGPRIEAFLLLAGWLLVSTNPIATAMVSEAILLLEHKLFLFSIPMTNGMNLTLVSPWILYLLVYLALSLILLWLSVWRIRQVER